MKRGGNISLKTYLLLALPLILAGCGGNGAVLTISPIGPTIVLKGATLQFTASRTDVTWAVQGSGNGTISNQGLYTAPSTLPVGLPLVVVQAKSSDGQVASATASLRTGDALAFGQPSQVNPNPLNGVGLELELEVGGLSDRLSVRLGTVQEDTTLATDNGTPATPVPNLSYSQALNFAPFSTPVNLVNDLVNFSAPTAIETDSQENPWIIFAKGSGFDTFQLFSTKSDDHGAHFGAPVAIATPALPTNVQLQAAARLDDQDHLHVAFLEEQPTPSPQAVTIFSTRSDDGGATWSPPVTVSTSTGAISFFPSLAIDPTGNDVFVCWTTGFSGSGGSANIAFSASSNGGGSFGTPLPLTTSNKAELCRVAVAPNGKIFVAFGEQDMASKFNIFLVSSSDGGKTFSPEVQINSDPANAQFPLPMISVDNLGRLDAIWSADPDNSGDLDSLMYARSLDDGAHFSANVPVAQGTSGNSSTGSIILPRALRHDDSGRLYIQYDLGSENSSSTSYNIFTLVGE